MSVQLNETEVALLGIIVTGVITLCATFLGVFLAETYTKRRRRTEDKRIFQAHIRYLFGEIIFNYEQIKLLRERLENPPLNKRDVFVFIDKFIEDFKDEVFLAFISSGAVASYLNDKLNDAIQIIYLEIWRIKSESKLSADTFSDEFAINTNEVCIIEMGELLFQSVKMSVIQAKNIIEKSAPIITYRMKTEGLTFKVESEKGVCFELTNSKELQDYFSYRSEQTKVNK